MIGTNVVTERKMWKDVPAARYVHNYIATLGTSVHQLHLNISDVASILFHSSAAAQMPIQSYTRVFTLSDSRHVHQYYTTM